MPRYLLTAFALLITASVVLATVFIQQPTPSDVEPPRELIKAPILGSVGKAARSDLVRSWYDWDTLDKLVTVQRRERETTTSAWSEQVQELTTSYFVVDVRPVCGPNHQISELFVTGVYPAGQSCIERWVFTYPATAIPVGGGYVPLAQRRFPGVSRQEILRTSQYGHIRSIEPDPQGRFVLFLTHEQHVLYRKPLPTGDVVVELAVATEPYLAQMQQVIIQRHVTQGAMIHLSPASRWHASPGAVRDSMLMIDSTNDGVFETRLRLTDAQWESAGYQDTAAWVNLCP